MSKQGTVNRPALAAAMVVPARVVGETAIAMVVVTVKVLVSGFGTLVTLRVTPTMFAAVMMVAILLVKPVAPSDTMTLVTEAAVMVVLPSGMVISYAAFTASARRRASRTRQGHHHAASIHTGQIGHCTLDACRPGERCAVCHFHGHGPHDLGDCAFGRCSSR
ncbi:unnamed protein product [Polarella glacialis]|uniref:Uncharacterized protein n=1 Tax=Polarella glacialis TaxID=89957 RepID=A0A813LTZ4_POLGL|nr:unnamed protein product [Polarella glacialis]